MRRRPRSCRLPAHRGSAAYCRTSLRRLHRFLRAQRARQSVPTACAAFIASSRAMCVSSKYHSPRPWARRAHPLHDTHDPPRAQHLLQPLPIAHAAVITSPPAATVFPPHYPPLEASPCLARGVRYAAPPKYAPSAHPLRRRRRSLETSTCSPLRAPSSVRSTRCSCPPIVHTLSAPYVHPQRQTAPLDSAAHFPSPAPAAITRLRANGRPTTRRQCAPRASTRTRLSLFASARRRTCAGRQRKRSRSIRCPGGF
jgi:hypothetical protein